mgnify:CR=1 FL=1
MKKEINFKREIRCLRMSKLFSKLKIVIMAITFVSLIIIMFKFIAFIDSIGIDFRTFTFPIAGFIILVMLWLKELLDHFLPEEKIKYYKSVDKKNYSGENIISLFEKKYFFENKPKKIYIKIFEKYYSKDFETFKIWLNSKKITPKELYIKMLSNKEVQKDIEEEYTKIILTENTKTISDEITKIKKLEEKKIKERELGNQIEDYFSKN